MYTFLPLLLAGTAFAGVLNRRQDSSSEAASSTSVPDYFQTTPEWFPGPTETGKAPFLNAQSQQWGMTYHPPYPLQTALPIAGNSDNKNIFELMGQLSPNFPSPGFGADEYPLPPGTNITQAHLIHRHGARYPTGDSSVSSFGRKIEVSLSYPVAFAGLREMTRWFPASLQLAMNITSNGTATWTGDLSFLNAWKYDLGAEILVPRGRQELFDSGVLHYYGYGRLYDTNTKILARTTSQDRMMKSAEYWLAGFFGQEWTKNATLEVILEDPAGSNNSLAGYFGCNNSNTYVSTGGNNASRIWEKTYLADARERFSAATEGYNWTIADVYNAQTLCPYETVAFGYSAFCDLFTYEEWQGFEYTIDLQFYGNNGFGSPTGRGVGIGYVEELYARLQNHLYDLPAGATQANITLDTMNSTFPLNQTLYFDFSHDTNIYSIITALGLRQFNQSLPSTGPPSPQQAIVSHMTPFAARMLWEIIAAPHPVNPTRPSSSSSSANNASMSDFYNTTAGPTMYVHQTLGQRTIPLWKSYPECEERDDGWCEMGTYLQVMGGLLETARYEESCWGSYPSAAWGEVSDGVPVEEGGNNGTTASGSGSGNVTVGQVKRMLGARSLAWLGREERVE